MQIVATNLIAQSSTPEGVLPYVVGGFFLLFGLFAFAFWLWNIIDCLKHETSEGNQKLIWILIMFFLSWIGAVIHFFFRRPRRPSLQTS